MNPKVFDCKEKRKDVVVTILQRRGVKVGVLGVPSTYKVRLFSFEGMCFTLSFFLRVVLKSLHNIIYSH